MFATRHAVFIGPGKLPDELRQVLLQRAGSPQPDIAIQTPRLLAFFDSAADAERIASQVQRLKLGVAIAGPEQPPAEDAWLQARALKKLDAGFRVTLHTGDELTLDPAAITAVTLVDWRPATGTADRAVLLTSRETRPILARASRLDSVSSHSLPLEGIKRLNELLDAIGAAGQPSVRVRTRRVSEDDFGAGVLTGDLLPLAVATIDAVDSLQGELPRPLTPSTAALPQRPSYSALGAFTAWALYLGSLVGLAASLGLLTLAVMLFNLTTGVIGLSMFAWGTRRFMWSRWLARSVWGPTTPVPAWPISPAEAGLTPALPELALDAVLLGCAGLGAVFNAGLPQHASVAALLFSLGAVFTSMAAVAEAWKRE